MEKKWSKNTWRDCEIRQQPFYEDFTNLNILSHHAPIN